MSTPPDLFDRAALAAHRRRAAALPGGPALFLHETVADEIEERLKEVNRSFTAPAVVTGWPGPWAGWGEARIVPDADLLDLPPAGHDLVVHALALHWAADPVGQLVQCRRALRPDGLCLAAFLGGRTLWELREALTEAESAVTGGLSPRVAPMGDVRDVGGLLQRAGLALPVADVATLTVRYRTPFHLMRDLRAMGETNALTGRLRQPTRRAVLDEAARIYAARHAGPDGRVPATFDIVYLTGWAPADSQPKPLRPGSATRRLADALGTTERRGNWSDR